MLATSTRWRRRSLRVITVALAIPFAGLVGPGSSFAQDPRPEDDYIRLIQPPVPVFANGFQSLVEQLGGDIVGDPLEFEHPASDADAVQLTTKGLLVWRKGQPVGFTDGWQTFLLKAPPGSAVASAPEPALAVSGVWVRLAQCESGNNPRTNTGNGYYGMFQEDSAFWANYGNHAYARPDLAPAYEQLAAAQRGLAVQGWGAWPRCSRIIGAR